MHLYMFLSLSFLSSLPPRERPLLAGNSIGESCEIKQFIEPPACGVYTADLILQTINKDIKLNKLKSRAPKGKQVRSLTYSHPNC